MPGVQAAARKGGKVHLHGAGHDLEKTAGAGRAFVVHHKMLHAAVRRQANDLAVLSPNVNNRPGVFKQRAHAHCMAGNFGIGFVRLFHIAPAIPGAHHPANLLRTNFSFITNRFHYTAHRLAMVAAAAKYLPRDQAAVLRHQRGVDGNRPNVDAQIHIPRPPVIFSLESQRFFSPSSKALSVLRFIGRVQNADAPC